MKGLLQGLSEVSMNEYLRHCAVFLERAYLHVNATSLTIMSADVQADVFLCWGREVGLKACRAPAQAIWNDR